MNGDIFYFWINHGVRFTGTFVIVATGGDVIVGRGGGFIGLGGDCRGWGWGDLIPSEFGDMIGGVMVGVDRGLLANVYSFIIIWGILAYCILVWE